MIFKRIHRLFAQGDYRHIAYILLGVHTCIDAATFAFQITIWKTHVFDLILGRKIFYLGMGQMKSFNKNQLFI